MPAGGAGLLKSKMKIHYNGWTITRPLSEIFREVVAGWQVQLDRTAAARV